MALKLKPAHYRADIDGLRALAVLSVVVYHAFPQALPGGFVGVDVFFVISGYLISGILLEQIGTQRFDLGDFYQRRIRRIFPALCVVLACCWGMGYVALFPEEFRQLGSQIASGASFTSNFALWGASGYFDTDAAVKPLLHLWSLGIEEQFYIFWPLLLWLISKTRLGYFTPLGLVVIGSFGMNLWLAGTDQVADFYSPIARAWELGLGALLALSRVSDSAAKKPWMRNVLSVSSLLGLLAACLFERAAHYPGVAALLPTTASAGLLIAGSQAFVNRKFLSTRVLVAVGLISYPLYLWHWPLLSYARIVTGETPGIGLRLMLVALAFLCAWLTYRWIELPARFGSQRALKTVGAVGAMIALAVIGQGTFLHHGDAQRPVVAMNPIADIATSGTTDPHAIDGCYLSQQERIAINGCLADRREMPRFALIGDSKADALASGLIDTSLPGARWAFFGNNCRGADCNSTILLSQHDYPQSFKLTRMILDSIEAHPELHTIVIANAKRTMFKLVNNFSIDELPQTPYEDLAFDAFDHAVSELIDHGREVYLLIDNPTLLHPEDCSQRVTSLAPLNVLLGLPHTPAGCAMTFAHFRSLSAPYDRLMTRIVRRHPQHLHVIDPRDIYCDEARDLCPVVRDGHRLYGGSDHIAYETARLVGMRINALLAQAQATTAPERVGASLRSGPLGH